MSLVSEMSRNDMSAAYSGTWVKHNGKPFYVDTFNDEGAVGYYSNTTEMRNIPPVELNVDMPDGGMMQHGKHVLYVSRAAARQWRRGLRHNNLRIYRLDSDGSVHLRNASPTGLIAQCLEEPVYDETIISRDWARVGDYLFFRTIPVGRVSGFRVESDLSYKIPLPRGYAYV